MCRAARAFRRGMNVVLAATIGHAPVVLWAEQEPAAGVEPTRLFFAPTARSLPRGDGSFGVTEIAFPWAEVGVVDRVSLRTIVLPPLEGLTDAGVVLGAKLQLVRHRSLQVAVGGFHGFGSSDSGGVGYGVATVGGRDSSVTFGMGYGYGSWVDSEGSAALVFVGAEKALGRRVRLIAEGYLGGTAFGLPEQTLIAGTRLNFGRWSLDLAMAMPFYETGAGTPGPVITIGRAF